MVCIETLSHSKAKPLRGQRDRVLPLAQPSTVSSAGPSVQSESTLKGKENGGTQLCSVLPQSQLNSCYNAHTLQSGTQKNESCSFLPVWKNDAASSFSYWGREWEEPGSVPELDKPLLQPVNLFFFMKGLSQMCERMVKTVHFVTPRYQKHLCEAWISTGKK